MSRRSIVDEFIENGKVADIIQMRYDNKTYQQIADAFGISTSTVIKIINKVETSKPNEPKENNTNIIEETPVDKCDVQEESAYDKLYKNRKYVVSLKKQGFLKAEIAKMMGVSDQDVFDFFDKNIKLTPTQIRELKTKYEQGADIKTLADSVGANEESLKRLLKVTSINKYENTEVIKENQIDTDCIMEFSKYINAVEYKYKNMVTDEEKVQKEMQDILHKIEFNDYEEDRAVELINEVKELRGKRREIKDFLTLTKPLIDFLNTNDNARILKAFASIAGQIHNQAISKENRIYTSRFSSPTE